MNTVFQKIHLNTYLRWAARLSLVIVFVFLTIGSPSKLSPANAKGVVITDDFNELNAWWWLGEDPPQFSFAENGEEHYLRMLIAGNDPDHPRNQLMRSIPDGDFSITTRVLFEPNANYQAAGLILYQDEDNFLSIVRAFCDVPGDCVGNGIYFDSVIGGSWGGNFAKSVENLSEAYLRLERNGNSVTAFYRGSLAEAWLEIGTHSLPEGFVINGAGLTTGQDFFTQKEDFYADFDFLTISPSSGDEWNNDFNGPTLDAWWWVGDQPSIVQTGEQSYLRLPASQDPAEPRNMLLRAAAPGDFSIVTRLLFMPNTNFQIAGLVIYQDDGNFLQFGRAYCDVEGMCVGDGIYFDYVQGGGLTDGNFAAPVNPGDIYLRLERRGNMVRAFYSLDNGTRWYIAGDHWIPDDFQVNGVGLVAAQDISAVGISADFDFFQLSEGFDFLPEGYHDYDEGDVPSWACNAGGWAVDPDNRAEPINVDVVVDDQPVETLLAEQSRQDLLDAGLCEGGNCGFSTSLWGVIDSYISHTVATWAQDYGKEQWVLLYNSNKPLLCRTQDIYIFDPETGQTRPVADLPNTDEYNPRWSPDNKKVAFDVYDPGESVQGIYITDLRTGVTAPLTGAEDGGNDPDWAPNGKWIVFDRFWVGDWNLYIVPPTGGEPQLLKENAIMASWSPNSKRIAFVRPDNWSIWTLNLETGAENFIAANSKTPAWSPDGAWIAYEHDNDIWKVRVDNQGVRIGDSVQLTSMPTAESRPSWSLNSKTIVFHAGMTSDFDLWTIPSDGGIPTWFTGAPKFADYDPDFSPRGKFVAYSSFSPQGQVARQWVSDFTADLAPGYWSPGTHTYSYNWAWTVPEPGSISPDFSRELFVTDAAEIYPGSVLLRGRVLRGFRNPEGFVCEEVDVINPDQPTQLNNGWLTDTEMTYAEAAAQIASITTTAVVDNSQTFALSPHEIYPWTMLDWQQYVCTFTQAPLRLDLRVNYGHDWVESFYEEGHQIDITVTDSEGEVRDTATVFTQPRDEWGGQPGFQTTDENWGKGTRPDIQPYDWVYATVDNSMSAQVQIGDITGEVDSQTDSITGTVNVPGVTDPVFVQCLDWGSANGPFNKDVGFIAPDGSQEYSCNWDPVNEWDVLPGQNIGVGYFTPEGAWVATTFYDPRSKMDLRVNYGHDWVESFYEAGHAVSIKVTDGDGNVKGTANVITLDAMYPDGPAGFTTVYTGWTSDPPDIQQGDWVYAEVDNGITAKVQIGEITGTVDPSTDSITGMVIVPGVIEPVFIECLDWGSGAGPFNKEAGFIAPDGSQEYTCNWDPVTEWDVQAWQDIGVGYFTPEGAWVANAFHAEE